MKRWLRKLRGILGIGAIWGVVGAAVGALGGIVAGVFGGAPIVGALVEFGLGAGGLGFLLGSAFAGLLTVAEGRRNLQDLSPGRAAVWGAIAGAGLPFLWLVTSFGAWSGVLSTELMLMAALAGSVAYGAVAAGLAAGTLALARRAPAELTPGPQPEAHGALPSGPGPPTGS